MLVASDLAPADTAGLDPALVLALVTEKGGATSHTAIIARQLGIPCVVGVAGALGLAGRRHRAGRRDRRHRRPRRRRGRCPGPGRGGPGGARGGRVVDRPRRDHRRRPGQAAGQRRGRRVGPLGVRRTGRGSGPVPHRAVLPRPARGADGRRAGDDLRRGARRLRRQGPVRRRTHPRCRLGQADRLRDARGRGEPGPRRPWAAARAEQPRAAGAPARRDRRGGVRRRAPRPG